jgi:predicted double-glycine peptidase
MPSCCVKAPSTLKFNLFIGAWPSGKAPVFGTGIRGFESLRPSQAYTLDVDGTIMSMGIKKIYDDNHLHMQETPYTCGPASILNVLWLKDNHDFNEGQIAKLCDTKPGKGTSNDNLIKGIEQVGLEIAEQKPNSTIEDIRRNLNSNNIVIVNYFDLLSNEGHYSVVTEIDDEFIYLRDCWFGLLRLSIKRFRPVWHSGDSPIQSWYVAIVN